jgi:hypothetical protein
VCPTTLSCAVTCRSRHCLLQPVAVNAVWACLYHACCCLTGLACAPGLAEPAALMCAIVVLLLLLLVLLLLLRP